MHYTVIKHNGEHEGNVENTSRRQVFSTFIKCSQRTGVFYHSVMHLSMSSQRGGAAGHRVGI